MRKGGRGGTCGSAPLVPLPDPRRGRALRPKIRVERSSATPPRARLPHFQELEPLPGSAVYDGDLLPISPLIWTRGGGAAAAPLPPGL